MGTLQGQNIRVLLYDYTAQKYKVVGKSTNCVVELTGNTSDVSTKDDVELVAKPEITSKSWSVSVDSLDVTDTAALLTAIKNMTLFTLLWDEVDPGDNQMPLGESYQRYGKAYLSDVTFSWNDREDSTKSLQFTGTGPLEREELEENIAIANDRAFTKGQYVRLFISRNSQTAASAILAACKSLSLHVSLALEESSTKDSDSDWQVQEPTTLTWDISSNALVKSGETITSSVTGWDFSDLQEIYENSAPVKVKIANVTGANNRTASATILSGLVVFTKLSLNAPNRSAASYDTQMSGYGAYTVGQ